MLFKYLKIKSKVSAFVLKTTRMVIEKIQKGIEQKIFEDEKKHFVTYILLLTFCYLHFVTYICIKYMYYENSF
jgi:hypothetical protein